MQNKNQALKLSLIFIAVLLATFGVTVALAKGGPLSPLGRGIFFGVLLLEMVGFFFACLRMNPDFQRRRSSGRKAEGKAADAKAANNSGELKISRRAIPVFIAAAAVTVILFIIGRSVSVDKRASELLSAFVIIVTPLMLGGSFIAGKLYQNKLKSTRLEEMQDKFHARRELAEKAAAASSRKLRRLRILTRVMAGLLVLCGMIAAFLKTSSVGKDVPLALLGFALISIGLMRLVPFKPLPGYSDEDIVTRTEFPELYRTAEDEARRMGCLETVRILIESNAGIGVSRYGNAVYLHLGVFPLSIFSGEELRCVLRHEFSHVNAGRDDRDAAYNRSMMEAHPRHFLSWLEDLFFLYPDSVYALEYFMKDFAASVITEQAADRAMAEGGMEEAAASALLKINYCDLYSYELDAREGRVVYDTERPPANEASENAADLKAQIALRGEFWNGLLKKEIIANNATHPTLRMRLEALGVEELRVLPAGGSPAFEAETEKALKYVDSRVEKLRAETYEKDRRRLWLEPNKVIDDWKAQGEPLAPETYAPILDALQGLSRHAEADALCDRIFSELPEHAHAHAHLVRGFNMLHRFEDGGIEHLYSALESHNYIDFALEEIGAYCCLTGNAEELARYREKAGELFQKEADEFSQLGELKRGDKLSKETLPEGVLEETLAYIRSAENGEIDKIWLVRKAISEELFTSVFIVRFREDADGEKCNEIMEKIFQYLDKTTDWQYSLFEYGDVSGAKFESVEGSLVYSREE